MTKVLVAGNAKQGAVSAKAGGELKIGEERVSPREKPILFLGEIVMGYSGAMQFSQCRFRRPEIGGIAERLGDMQRHAVDPAAHQHAAAGMQKRRRNAKRSG